MKVAFLCVLLISGMAVAQAPTSAKRTPKTSPKSAVPNDKEISKTILEFEETLRRAALAGDCATDTTAGWSHAELDHNDPDRQRLVEKVKPFLF